MELIARGAEADIYKAEIFGIMAIIKLRVVKRYRIKDLDLKIRRSRSINEAKIMIKAYDNGVNVPRVLLVTDKLIAMEYIDGETFSEKHSSIIDKIAAQVAKLHSIDIIHGDLTTRNILVRDNKPYIIDFGLASISKNIEDKAMDLIVLERSLGDDLFHRFMDDYRNIIYNADQILERISEIKKRVRYAER
ncbi:MAG: Kae1-associated kinase Bud32 [Candidatus Micrarchaeota archaeon]|nr:MAG: Kae1-associated kinase Bud32 [Candidatus Micrarchaeota archaeon]